jgi:uncharacterized protein YneF (UPF0154 family)
VVYTVYTKAILYIPKWCNIGQNSLKKPECNYMDILTLALTMLITTALNLFITFMVIKLILRQIMQNPMLKAARMTLSNWGTKSQSVQHQRKQIIKNKETETKLLDGLIESLPMGGAIKNVMKQKGLSGTDVFEALQDENFVKGVMFLWKTFGGLIGKITGKSEQQEQGVAKEMMF